MLVITPTIAIDDDDIEERFIRASGPGGQNVNKVATAVQLRFDMAHSKALTEPAKQRLKRLAGRRLNNDGILVIEARRHRTRERNREDARQRLIGLIEKAAKPEPPRKRTRPPRKVAARRLEGKHRRAETKSTRGPIKNSEG